MLQVRFEVFPCERRLLTPPVQPLKNQSFGLIVESHNSSTIIEGHGVEQDIYVENDPAKEYDKIDQQLNKAIEVILGELRTQEKEIPPLPSYPVK